MSSMWRNAMVYLGLGPDDEYDDYAASPDDRPMPPMPAQTARQQPARPTGTVRARPPVSSGTVLSTPPETGEVSAVRPVAAPTSYPAADQDASKPRAINNRAATGVEFMVRVATSEIAIGFFCAPDADRAPVDERSIKEPHRAET